MGKTKTTSMGRNAGIFGGLVNAGAGHHSHKTTGDSGKKPGFGSTRQKSQDNYNKKNSK